MAAVCDACRRELEYGERLQNWDGFWICPRCAFRLKEEADPPPPSPLPVQVTTPEPEAPGLPASLVMAMVEAVQSCPTGAGFDVIGSVIGQNVLLRMRSGELVLIRVGDAGLDALARRAWGWKFPKLLFHYDIDRICLDWPRETSEGTRLQGATILGGMMCAIAECRNVTEVESICLSGFRNPLDVGRDRWAVLMDQVSKAQNRLM